MSTTPAVSLLIPSFNNVATIGAAIQSCLQQTNADLEILVYDEASRDGTRDVIHELARSDERIRVLTSETNSGPVRAWRHLLAEARGRFFTFVWSDDLLMPEFVATLKQVLEAHPTHLLAGAGAYCETIPEAPARADLSPQPDRHRVYPFETVCLKGDEYALGVFAGVFPLTQICSLYRTEPTREVFDHYIQFENPYGFDFSRRAYGNDVSFLSELALRSGEVVQTGTPLVVLRASQQNMTGVALRAHRWDFWLQYSWAIASAWTRCRSLSPRMDTLVRVATDRLHFADTVAACANRRRPRFCNPWRIARALRFLLRQDHRLNARASPASIIRWLNRETA